jgi:hypothetical protein
MYNHIIGPNVNAIIPLSENKETIIIASFVGLGESYSRFKNNNPIISRNRAQANVPNCSNVFRPIYLIQ